MREQLGEGPRGHVVVIDDDTVFCDMLRTALSLDGFKVSTAADGPAGVALVGRVAPDAVVLDVNLPAPDGFDCLVRIRAMGEIGQLPVLVLTADDSDELRERGRSMGADRFLTKPVDLQLLVWNLDELLTGDRPPRVNPLAGLRQQPTIPPGLF